MFLTRSGLGSPVPLQPCLWHQSDGVPDFPPQWILSYSRRSSSSGNTAATSWCAMRAAMLTGR